MSLFLCYFGDSALWDNTVLIPGYPQKYSYFRPFRYTDSLVQRSLLAKIKNEQNRKDLVNKEVILGTRFRNEKNKWTVLPIRKVTIEHIDYMPDNHSVYFSMGPLYDFTAKEVKTLADACVKISPSDRNSVDDALFFEANLPVPLPECNEAQEDPAWVMLVNLISQGKNIPLKKEATKSIYFRFNLLRKGKLTKKGIMYQSPSLGQKEGATLSEGASYEMILYHRVPLLLDKPISLTNSMIKFKAPTGNLEISPSEEELTGNYQKHVLNIAALKPSGAWEEIIIEMPEQIKSQDEKETLLTTNIHIPLKVRKSFWYRLLRTYIFLIIIWGSLFAGNIFDKIIAGKTDWTLIIISAVIAIVSAFGVYGLEQKVVTK